MNKITNCVYIANAVMHRDYFETGANVQVDIFDDRIVISNIGSLIKPLTKAKLGKIAVRRNPLIADLFHRIGYVEKMGTGLVRIRQQCKKQDIKVEIETDRLFIIKFQRGIVNVPVSVPVNKRQRWLLDHLSKYGRVTTREYQNRFTNISLKTIKRDLAYLRKNKIIAFTGAPKTGYYKLIISGSVIDKNKPKIK